jgi:endonuclease/exonuclease/phosphatase family metal-dependent hydrolase
MTPTLAVVTWNLHAGRGDLARLRYDLASGSLTGAVPIDYVLLLQEVVRPVDAQGLSVFFAPVRGDSGNAILSTRPLIEPRVIALERERQPRSAIAATLRLDAASLFIADVHMENRLAWWRALFSDTARGEQASALLRELPAGDGILGGDLNTWLGPNEPAWRAMLRRFPDTPRDPPQPTFHDRLVLDHLFFDLPAGWRVSRRVINNAYGSDHHPVVATVTDPSLAGRPGSATRPIPSRRGPGSRLLND